MAGYGTRLFPDLPSDFDWGSSPEGIAYKARQPAGATSTGRRRRTRGRLGLVEISIDDRQVAAALKRMRENVTDMRKLAWPVVLPAVFEANRQTFGTEGPPLTEKYAKWKAAHGGGSLLVLTGGLREQFTEETSRTDESGRGQKITRGKRELRFQTTWESAYWHQRGVRSMRTRSKGGGATHRGLPARPPMPPDSPIMEKALADAWGQVALKWAQDFGRQV